MVVTTGLNVGGQGWARVFGGWRGSAEDQEGRDDVAVL